MLSLCCLLVCLSLTWGFPEGPWINETICTDMIPRHGYDIQTSPFPYKWILNDRVYREGKKVRIQIIPSTSDPDRQHYEGLFVQARCTNPGCKRKDKAIGTFQATDPLLKLNKCHDVDGSAISHNSHTHKNDSTFYWIPPKGLQDPIRFRLTLVRKTSIYWVGEMSRELRYAGYGANKFVWPRLG